MYATGKIYVKNPEPFIADTNIIFSLDKLKGENGDFKATIISHVEAQKFIDEARRDVANKNSKEINDKITKEAEISSRRNVVIEKIKSASKGDEDSCQGYKNIRVNLDDVIVKCQILAVKAPLSVFKDNNWLLTNVSSIQQDETGSTVIISIKKAR